MRCCRQATATADDMFENCFYWMNTSYLPHFSQSKNAIKEKVTDLTFDKYVHDFRDLVLDGEYTTKKSSVGFAWKPGSYMQRAHSMGLIFEDHRHLASLCMLFMAPHEVRRDFAALYRMYRTILMSRQDADVNSGVEAKRENHKQIIVRYLEGVIGNHHMEERRLARATDLLYWNFLPKDATDPSQRNVSTDEYRESFRDDGGHSRATSDGVRGFILLDRSSSWIHQIDPEQATLDHAIRCAPICIVGRVTKEVSRQACRDSGIQ